MLKIIHLSDLHIGYNDLGEKFQGMVTKLISLKQAEENCVVVITGDMVDDARRNDSIEEAKTYIDRIRDARFHVLIAPGNHDYGDGILADEESMKKFKEVFYSNPNEEFPRFDAIDAIAFIGLDSMEGEMKNVGDRGLANGEIGKTQLEKLENLLKEGKVTRCNKRVVYLHHHPFDTRHWLWRWWWRAAHGLDDAKKLKNILRSGNIDALLFGHNHDGKAWNGKLGIKYVYDAGSSTGKDKQGEHRMIDLSKDPDDPTAVKDLHL